MLYDSLTISGNISNFILFATKSIINDNKMIIKLEMIVHFHQYISIYSPTRLTLTPPPVKPKKYCNSKNSIGVL